MYSGMTSRSDGEEFPGRSSGRPDSHRENFLASKCVDHLEHSLLSQARVERISQAVAEGIETENGNRDDQRRPEDEPGVLLEIATRRADHVAPGRIRRRSPQAKKRQARFEQNRETQAE